MSGLKVENAKYCALLVLLTPYVDDISFCYGKSVLYEAMIFHTFLGTEKNDLEQTF